MKERVVPSYYYTNLDTGKYCGNTRYRIIASMTTTGITEDNFGYPYINGEKKYARILIKKSMKELKFGNICWFSNMDNKRYKSKKLTERFDPEKYPKYDNYDAINVDKIKDIPFDYDGVMGVPITVLEYLCPDGYIYFEVDED